jgi:hypothetical protein
MNRRRHSAVTAQSAGRGRALTPPRFRNCPLSSPPDVPRSTSRSRPTELPLWILGPWAFIVPDRANSYEGTGAPSSQMLKLSLAVLAGVELALPNNVSLLLPKAPYAEGIRQLLSRKT